MNRRLLLVPVMALFLAGCPSQTLRDPDRAVQLAEDVVQDLSSGPDQLECLGMAYYRAGNFARARAALEKARLLYERDMPLTCLYLAMTHARLKQAEQAESWFRRGVSSMERSVTTVLLSGPTRCEAAALLNEAAR